MAEYNNGTATYGTVHFGLSDVTETAQAATRKVKIGKTFVEKRILLMDAKDTILNIQGVIQGLSQTTGQTQATAIEADRAALQALEDGTYHTYSDGKHSGNYAIAPGSLSFTDEANDDTGQPCKFSMVLIQWQ